MKKLFIGLPSEGLSDVNIFKAKSEAESVLGEGVEILDPFVTMSDTPKGCEAIWRVGVALLLLAQADIVYFPKGWQKSTSCVIQNMCACANNLVVIEDN